MGSQGCVAIEPGVQVGLGGRLHRVVRLLDLETVLVAEEATGRLTTAKLRDLDLSSPGAPDTNPSAEAADLATLSNRVWAVAIRRYDSIRPFVEGELVGREAVHEAAVAAGVTTSTLYRWMRRFERTGRVDSLVPTRPGARAGQNRLRRDVDAIIRGTIEEYFLTDQRPSIARTVLEVVGRCRTARLAPPHRNTVRRRIAVVSGELKLRRRHGAKAAAGKYRPLRGHGPEPTYPLALVQIDHTKLDLELVDDVDRQPIGRAWLTLAIDVFSRLVAGFYVSFDPPGEIAVGLCIVCCVLPKEALLASLGVSGSWPIWGLPDAVHADNAPEFKGQMQRRAAQNYGIDLVWRPVAQPHYGGHIERLLGTFMKEVHTLAGTTFSNVAERERYDSAGKAVMTLGEFETWFATFIVRVYHQRPHDAIGMPPIRKYEEAVLGAEGRPGHGLPRRVADEARLRLDFLPYVQRTVQPYGIVVDGVHYYHDVLRPWISARDPEDHERKRLFIVRRDPRDISVVHFFDPELRQYHRIPYRDLSRPAMSLWELREVHRRLAAQGRSGLDEDAIFDGYARMRAIEASAATKTRSTRRWEQRRRMHEVARTASPPPAPATPAGQEQRPAVVAPFAEREEIDE